MRVWRTVRPTLAATALYAAVVVFAVWHLRQLERPALNGLFGWAAIAAAPAVLAALPGRRHAGARFGVLLLPTTVFAVGRITGHWPLRPHLLGSHGYFARVGGDLADGLSTWVHTLLPYSPLRNPDLRTIVLVGVFLIFTALAASLIVFRAPFPAIVIAFVPFLVVSTVYDLRAQTGRAAIMLALSLAILAVLTPRTRRFGQVAFGTAAIATGLVLAALPGVAKSEFVDWKHWGKTVRVGTRMSYVWNQTYGPLRKPSKPVQVLRVTTTHPAYLRTAVLDHFDGIRWSEEPVFIGSVQPPTVDVNAGNLSPKALAGIATAATATIHNDNLAEQRIPAPGETTQITGLRESAGAITTTSSATFLVANALPVGETYRVRFVPPTPTPRALSGAGATPIDAASTSLLDGAVVFPAWGSEGREAIVKDLFDQYFLDPRLARWREAYAKARQVTADATAPYGAVIELEHYFQTNYRYSDLADYSNAPDGPLPTFFLTRQGLGYCQMFSGSMAVLLRMLGIPARVVEGFTPGVKDKNGDYVIDDRAAHAWVEVEFDGIGWIPFEPTPGRGISFATYSSTSPGFSAQIAKDVSSSGPVKGAVAFGGKVPPWLKDPSSARPGGSRGGREGSSGGFTTSSAAKSTPWRPGFVFSVLGIVLLGAVLIAGFKRLRSLRVYTHRDPHSIAVAVRADLEAYVRDQGIDGAVSALTPLEFATMLRREFGVDARPWAAQMARARYGPHDERAVDAAVRARKEGRRVRRELRRGLTRVDRAKGAIRIRSLLP